jgi:hypothetical protein
MRDGHFAYDLLESCQAVHMSLTGASDPLPALEERAGWLGARLEDWRPGLGRSEAYDAAVRSVLEAVLEEYERSGRETRTAQYRETLPGAAPDGTRERLAALETKLSTARAVVESCKKFCGPSCPVCREQIAAVLSES